MRDKRVTDRKRYGQIIQPVTNILAVGVKWMGEPADSFHQYELADGRHLVLVKRKEQAEIRPEKRRKKKRGP